MSERIRKYLSASSIPNGKRELRSHVSWFKSFLENPFDIVNILSITMESYVDRILRKTDNFW